MTSLRKQRLAEPRPERSGRTSGAARQLKIRVLSDLHMEFGPWKAPQAEADVVVLAGDIHAGTHGLHWAHRQFPNVPVIYVPGNHEYYEEELEDALALLRREGKRFGIEVLDGNEVTVHGVRFLGATLWTDFALYGAAASSLKESMAYADQAMADFELIRYRGQRFEAKLARSLHLRQVEWFKASLATARDEPIVVVTHHLPHPLSVAQGFEAHPLTPAFASDLDHLVRSPVALWIHGHTHSPCDYMANGTRVVCNPRGYEDHEGFRPSLVIDLPIGART